MRKLLALGITFYRLAVSPWLPPACRFTPSCSEYALACVTRFGAVRGLVLAAWRILRCHPLARGGYDPVPKEWTGGLPLSGWRKSARRASEIPENCRP